jgi:hypothetical protein
MLLGRGLRGYGGEGMRRGLRRGRGDRGWGGWRCRLGLR